MLFKRMPGQKNNLPVKLTRNDCSPATLNFATRSIEQSHLLAWKIIKAREHLLSQATANYILFSPTTHSIFTFPCQRTYTKQFLKKPTSSRLSSRLFKEWLMTLWPNILIRASQYVASFQGEYRCQSHPKVGTAVTVTAPAAKEIHPAASRLFEHIQPNRRTVFCP
jgi:hypothetical protein